MGIVGKLLALLAVLLMPLGMSAAAAADHHASMAGASTNHCPDQSSQHPQRDGAAMCSMACASALPAQELIRNEPPVRRAALVMPVADHRLHGVLPEIATPPPKLA